MDLTETTVLDTNIKEKVNSLIEKMTLEEKVGQMNQYSSTWDVTGPLPEGTNDKERYQKIAEGKVGSMLNVVGVEATRKAQRIAVENSRLGVPLLFGYDVIHGFKTMFPIPIADASSWDLKGIELATRIAAIESAAAGVHWTFGPMMDISRDARWGRVIEGAGEDTFLGTKIAVARVKGFQGENLAHLDTIAATAKHFVGYGFVIAGLDYNTTELNRNTLLNSVFPPFKAAVDAGVATVMNSFNDINGIPVTGNIEIQRKVLKGKWEFEGPIVSDWNTIGEMTTHQYSKDLKEAAKVAAIAGTDIDMESQGYEHHLVDLVRSGEVDEEVVNEAARRILTLKFRLGLFDDPYAYCDEEKERKLILSSEHKAIALESAKKSIVLLKNEEQLLPISKKVKSIAVIGSLANDKDTPLGTWRAQAIPGSAISLLEGIENRTPETTTVKFAPGYTIASGEREFTRKLDFSNQEDTSGFEEAIALAGESELVIVALGEECFQSGEGRSQADISLRGTQLALLKKLKEVNSNIIVVLINGRPIAEAWMYENVPSVLECWQLGSESGNAIAAVLFGDHNPSGKLPVSIPRSTGQVPIYYNRNMTGRPISIDKDPEYVFYAHYTDSEKTPQYSFGHGLSYTKFEYSNLRVSSNEMALDEVITVNIDVSNTGEFDGEEVVQLYINDKYSSTIRPIKELKGFEKIHLSRNETKTVSFQINWETLAFFGANESFSAEPGEFEIMVGGNSEDLMTETIILL